MGEWQHSAFVRQNVVSAGLLIDREGKTADQANHTNTITIGTGELAVKPAAYLVLIRLIRSIRGFNLPPFWLSETSPDLVLVGWKKWQSAIWPAKMTEIQIAQNVVGLAQVGRISAAFPNLRKVESCASWEIPGTFLRKLGRESQKTGICNGCHYGKIGLTLRKLGKTAAIRKNRLRKLGKTAGKTSIADRPANGKRHCCAATPPPPGRSAEFVRSSECGEQAKPDGYRSAELVPNPRLTTDDWPLIPDP